MPKTIGPKQYTILFVRYNRKFVFTEFQCIMPHPFSLHLQMFLMGHGELLELRLLEKSARHDFIIARHRSSNNIFSCQLLESS